ncbi:unnamed protein product [Clavelina lepadiformis]|uniref:Uncharacterized protein n=1 Tax=Clavelina lepadiformis TaxID=159417 RepID=A0ABP0GAN2_CLALP
METVNSMNISGMQRTSEHVEHKWWDSKSSARKAVVKWKKEDSQTGGRVNTATCLPDTQFRVISIIRMQSVTGIGGASELETSTIE